MIYLRALNDHKNLVASVLTAKKLTEFRPPLKTS